MIEIANVPNHFKTGDPIPIHYSAFRIDDPKTGQPVNVGNVCSDITERKRAKLALGESREVEPECGTRKPALALRLPGRLAGAPRFSLGGSRDWPS
jgi:hypothetical protein